MADTSLIIGNGNWAVKETSLLGYNIIQSKYVPIDMTVSRATTATRVNSAGLIEVVPINLLTYSEQFDNAGWTKVGSTISANSTTAPNGTTTADKLIEDTSNGLHSGARIGAMASAGTYTLSIYAKVGERTSIAIGNASAGHYAIFDLSLGTVVQGSQGTVTNGAISSIDANGYYRVSCNVTITSLSSISVSLVSTGTTTSYLGNGTSGLFIWGAQLVTGTSAKEYFPTTDRFNIPRVDYSTGTASLLVEPARTNSVLYSEEFSNASWNTASTSTVTLNAGIAPSGNNTANLITATSVDGRRIQSVSLTAGTYTYSYFVKKGNQSSIQVLAFNSTLSAVAQTADFNLDSGTLTSGTGIIQQFTNGWYRVSVTFTIVLTNTIFLYIKSGLNNNAIGSTVFAWGAQIETGSNATSYIPTTTASVTRNADVISKTGISSLINSEEGVLFFKISNLQQTVNTANWITLSDSTTNATNYLGLRFDTDGTINYRIIVGGVMQASITTAAVNQSLSRKIAIKWKVNNFSLYIDGLEIGSDLSGSVFPLNTLSALRFNFNGTSNSFFGKLENLIVYPTALTDAQLATLTTL